jgi:hypothetical protein
MSRKGEILKNQDSCSIISIYFASNGMIQKIALFWDATRMLNAGI